MKNNQEICRRAFSLVERRPEGAGLTICLAGGEERFLLPEMSGGIEMSLLQTGIYRGEQRRPATDLRVYVEDRGGKIVGHVERVTGVAFLPTQIDPSEFVGHFEVDSWKAAEVACADILSDKLPGLELSATSVSYRHNKFAEKSFSAAADSQGSGWLGSLFGGAKNKELVRFIEDTVFRALDFNPVGRKARKVSLWLTLNGECMKTVYVDVEPRGRRFFVSASDRARWPWKEKAIFATVSEPEVSSKIAAYVDKAHGHDIRSLEVYFNWSEALEASM